MFNWVGGSVVLCWMGMMGLLIHKTHFQQPLQPPETPIKKVALKESERTWMEIFLKDAKVGYSMTQLDPLGDDYLMWEEVVLNLNLMGQPTAMRTHIRSLLDRELRLKHFTLRIESGAVRFRMSGKVEKERVLVEAGEGSQRTRHVVTLTGPPMTGAAVSMSFRGRKLKEGDSVAFLLFDPTAMAQKEIVVSVVDRETLVINRIAHRAFRLETEMWGQKVSIWVDDAGEVLQEEGFMGLRLVRSNAATAPMGLAGKESHDFYEMMAVDIMPKLKDAERLTYLKLRVKGVDERHLPRKVLNSGRQRFVGDVLEIIQEKPAIRAGYTLPMTDAAADLRPYLEPGLNIQSDDEAIVSQAREVLNGAADPVAGAKRLLTWVFQHVEKRPVLSLPSATDVLRSRIGDCNEHAVLLTALLRAAGIPARECVGLVYARDRFFYHAWTEAYLGRWISMDATLNQMPTDATHIKLVEGGLDRQTDIIPLIGKIEFAVMDYGYDSTN